MDVTVGDTQLQSRGKLFYKINEVSKITGLKPYVLRYWETEFPQLAPEKDDNDTRRYRRKDIDLIQRIKQLLYEEKFTIAGAKQRIANETAPAERKPRKAAAAAGPVEMLPLEPPAPVKPAPAPVPMAVAKPVATVRPLRMEAQFLAELTAVKSELEGLVQQLQA